MGDVEQYLKNGGAAEVLGLSVWRKLLGFDGETVSVDKIAENIIQGYPELNQQDAKQCAYDLIFKFAEKDSPPVLHHEHLGRFYYLEQIEGDEVYKLLAHSYNI